MSVRLLCVCPLSSPEPLEVWKHEWYHVVTNCLGHVFSTSGLPKVAKNCQKSEKSILRLSGTTNRWRKRAGRMPPASTSIYESSICWLVYTRYYLNRCKLEQINMIIKVNWYQVTWIKVSRIKHIKTGHRGLNSPGACHDLCSEIFQWS